MVVDEQHKSKRVCFEGGSWTCMWTISCVLELRKSKNSIVREMFNDPNLEIAGYSSGCLPGLFLALGKSDEEFLHAYESQARIVRRHGTFGTMSIFHDSVMDTVLPLGGNEYKKLDGRFFVYITRFPFKCVAISSFKSNEDVRNAMHQSMHIPGYCTTETLVQNQIAIDGGFGFSSSLEPEHSIILSPNSKSLRVNIHPLKRKPYTLMEIFGTPSIELVQRFKKDGIESAREYERVCKIENDSVVLHKQRQGKYKRRYLFSVKKAIAILAWLYRVRRYLFIFLFVSFIIVSKRSTYWGRMVVRRVLSMV